MIVFRILSFTFAAFVMLTAATLVPALSTDAFAQTGDEVRITDIQIAGNSKIETETIRSRMTLKASDVFSPSAVRSEISAIYKMGYFDDVQVDAEGLEGGLRLVFRVVERPIVRSFAFEGNVNVETTKLREKVTITPYSVYNPSLVADNVQVLKLYYQGEGYFNISIVPVVEKVNDKEVKVIFLAQEGEKVMIDDLDIEGNENISTRRIKKVMSTKEYNILWSWLLSTGTYKLFDFSMDLERIKALYFNNGFIQMSMAEPEVALDEDNNELDITLRINEGLEFSYGKMSFSGNTVFSEEELKEKLHAETGDVMNRDQLKQDIVDLTDMYGSKGYAFASISPVIDPHADTQFVDVDFVVEEGDLIHVNRINITGNAVSRDWVIRRELPFDEGGIFDTSGLKKSDDRLKNLDYYEDVEITPNRMPDTTDVNLDVRVKEKSTGSFSIGGGYSTVDRLMAIGEVKQKNLFGKGQELNLRIQWGKRRHDISLSFNEPWLFGRPVSLGLELFNEERNQNVGFSVKTMGGSISLGRRFMDYWSLSGSYAYSQNKYFNVSEEIIATSMPNAFDDVTISKIGIGLARDTRDVYVDTTSGSKNSLYAEMASTFLGSQTSYYKAVADTVWFFPFYWDTVFSLHGRAGLVYEFGGKEVPPSELFYMGGINTIRGYDWGSIGPRPLIGFTKPGPGGFIRFRDSQVIGGNKELLFNAEYTFPLVPAIKLRGVMFFDAGDNFGHSGSVNLSKLRYSAGGGFRWASPMGLIRLEYGKVLDGVDPEQTGKWEFSIGTMF